MAWDPVDLWSWFLAEAQIWTPVTQFSHSCPALCRLDASATSPATKMALRRQESWYVGGATGGPGGIRRQRSRAASEADSSVLSAVVRVTWPRISGRSFELETGSGVKGQVTPTRRSSTNNGEIDQDSDVVGFRGNDPDLWMRPDSQCLDRATKTIAKSPKLHIKPQTNYQPYSWKKKQYLDSPKHPILWSKSLLSPNSHDLHLPPVSAVRHLDVHHQLGVVAVVGRLPGALGDPAVDEVLPDVLQRQQVEELHLQQVHGQRLGAAVGLMIVWRLLIDRGAI